MIKKADYTTWCSDKMLAGVKLEKILNEINEPELIRTVNSTISRFDRRLSLLRSMKSQLNANVQYFALLMLNDMKELEGIWPPFEVIGNGLPEQQCDL